MRRVLWGLVVAGPAFAGNTTFLQQGRLLGASGAVVDGTPDLVFRLYTADAGGSPVFTETIADVPVDGGYYSVHLGAGSTPLDSTVFVNNAQLWLTVEVEGGVELAPRLPVSTVPRSVVAEQLARPTGLTFASVSGNLGARVFSANATLTGFTGPAIVEISGPGNPMFQVDGGNFVTAASVQPGQVVRLAADAPSIPGSNLVSVRAGGAVVQWTVTSTATNATCKTLMDAGLATANGTQLIDPDGPGGRLPFQVYCDISGGGWTWAANGVPFRLDYTGNPQRVATPVVPATFRFDLYGASGGAKSYPLQDTHRVGALGGRAGGDRTFAPNTELFFYVGQEGGHGDVADSGQCLGIPGGWNGGGRATRSGGGGGGATDVRLIRDDLYSRILVAGGGGGCAYGGVGCDYAGGAGGGSTGASGANAEGGRPGGGGGSQTAGGVVGSGGITYANGKFGKGGDAAQCNDEGGGGGGWYGGSAGGFDNRTGGGGSNYVGGVDVSPTPTNSQGVNQRDGYATYIFK
jgi:hypothetical protein